MALYDLAIQSLGQAVQKNPENREAYFERAISYFEQGNFDRSIDDFLQSGYLATPINAGDGFSYVFAKGFVKGAKNSCLKSMKEFVPSMLSTLSGISHGLWAFAVDPVEVSKEWIWASQRAIEFIQTHDLAQLCEVLVPEIKELRSQGLSFERKGELFGQIIGCYGTEVLLLAGMSKGMKVYQELRRANAALTFEKLAQNPAKMEALAKVSSAWWEKTAPIIEEIKANNGRIGNKLHKAFRDQPLSEIQVRRILHQAGFKTFPRPKGVPNNVTTQISKKNGGMVYVKAGTAENESLLVRVMPGNPESPNPMQQKPYVVQRKGKEAISKGGALVDRS